MAGDIEKYSEGLELFGRVALRLVVRMSLVKRSSNVALVLLSVAVMIGGAQAPTKDDGAQDNQVHDTWTDPSTGLMWAGRDNGKDVNWHKAMHYCRDLRLAGYSDWRLPGLADLERIYDKTANAPGRVGHGTGRPSSWHVKGNLFLTGYPWSSTNRLDDRGSPTGLVWYLRFSDGVPLDEDSSNFSGRFADYSLRALCVRGSEK